MCFRTSIVEQYKEFYANDICTSEPDACEWIGEQLKGNHEYVKRMVKAKSDSDPFWHLVGLFYKQMEGITRGYQLKKRLEGGSNDNDIEITDHEIHLINFVPDFWDMIEAYHLVKKDRQKRHASRPTCSVLIKHMPDQV